MKAAIAVVALLFAASLSGCGTVATVGTQMMTAAIEGQQTGLQSMEAGTVTLDKKVDASTFVKVATETGKSMGYVVTTNIQNYGSDGLVATATMTKGGKKSLFDAWHITLTATLGADGKTVTLNPMVIGDPPDRTSLVGAMKQALAAKLGT